MSPRTRSAAGLTQNIDFTSVADDEEDLPNSPFAIMNPHPEPQIERRRRLPGIPEIAYTIPQEIYLKAQNQQNELTDAERQLLLSRGDLIGRALAQPSSLTEVECYKVLNRPPPDVTRTRIDLVSNGELSTVAELVVKATPDASGLNDAELDLMANNFHVEDMEMRFMRGEYFEKPGVPGAVEAVRLWSSHGELGFAEEVKTIGAARVEQFRRKRATKEAARLAAKAAKEAQANTPESLQQKKTWRALKKEEQDVKKVKRVNMREINELTLKVELETELGNLEKDELRRQIKEKQAQDHTMFLKCRDIRDRIYKLGPPNPHKELGEPFALKQKAIETRLVELSKQLEGLQAQGNKSEEDEVKGKMEDCYTEWAVITQDYEIARQPLFGKTASEARIFGKDEVHQEQISLKLRVIMVRKMGLQMSRQKLEEDDTDTNELEQQIEDNSVQCKNLQEEERELIALRYRSLGMSPPPPEPHQRDAAEELYIEEQKKKTQEDCPEVSEQGVEKMLEDRWQGMKSKERRPYRRQASINWFKAMKARPRPATPEWENFD